VAITSSSTAIHLTTNLVLIIVLSIIRVQGYKVNHFFKRRVC